MAFTDWRLDVEVRAGAMGVVWRTTHVKSGTPAAVKVVRPRPRQSFARMAQEVAAHARLCHPNIVGLYDFGRTPSHAPGGAGQLWIAMEWCGGGDCAQDLPKDWPTVERYLRQLLAALAHAHAMGIIHRDIKPANLLLNSTKDRLVLADFGISRRGTSGEIRSGTPVYMAPEQIQGAGWQGPWTDLYAVAGVTWHWLTGTPPAKRETIEATLTSQLEDSPAFFYSLFDVPDRIEPWLRKALSKDPLERFQSASDALVALGSSRPVPRPIAHPPTMGAGVAELWPLRLAPLIGRNPEFSEFIQALEQVHEGTPIGLAVVGPPGIGRHHFLEHARAAIRTAGTLRTIQLQGVGPTEVREGLRQLLGDLDPIWLDRCASYHGCRDLLPAWTGFASAPGQALDPLALLAHAAGALPGGIAIFCPGADATQVLAACTERGVPALVAASGPWDGAATTIHLRPLSPNEVVEWAQVTLGDASLARQAFQETGGHPRDLESWLAHSAGVGFFGVGPDPSDLAQETLRVAVLVALLPQPGSLQVLRTAAGRLGLAGVDEALLELARKTVVRVTRDHVILALAHRDAVLSRGGDWLPLASGAMGDTIADDPALTLQAVRLLADAGRPLDAWRLLRGQLTVEVPASGLGRLARQLRPHLSQSEHLLAVLVSTADCLREGLDLNAFSGRMDELFTVWGDAVPTDDPTTFVMAMRVESVCNNGYREPGLARRVAEAAMAFDRSIRTGWGAIIASLAPWRRSQPAAEILLLQGIAEAKAAGQLRAEGVGRVQLAQLYLEGPRRQSAATHLRRACEIQPSRTTFKVLLAGALRDIDIEAYDQALEEAYLEGWRLRPKMWNWIRLGRCERQLERARVVEADREFESELMSLERSTDNLGQPVQASQVALLGAIYYAEIGHQEHAQAAWVRFVKNAPRDWHEERVVTWARRLKSSASGAFLAEVDELLNRAPP